MATEAPRRQWLPHDAFDPESALERGPSNGGARIPCPGVLELVGEADDVALLAVCSCCGYETGVLRSAVERVPEVEPMSEREELARWWNR
jgi:hypothetical protein